MYMFKCIYSLVQAPRQYHMLCRALYQKAGLKQLQTDDCMFIRDVYNIIGQQELTNKDLLINGKFLNTVETSDVVSDQMHVYKLCRHPVAAMIPVTCVDNKGIRHDCDKLVHEFDKSVKQDGHLD